jgi:hypothetical protein
LVQIPQAVGKRLDFNAVRFIQFALRHIPSHIQKLADALCRLLPCDKGSIVGIQHGIAHGDVKPALIEPNGYMVSTENETLAACMVFLSKKFGILGRAAVFFEV